RGRRDPGDPGRATAHLERLAAATALQEPRSVLALNAELQQRQELLRRLLAAASPQCRDGPQLVELRPPRSYPLRLGQETVGERRRPVQRDQPQGATQPV